MGPVRPRGRAALAIYSFYKLMERYLGTTAADVGCGLSPTGCTNVLSCFRVLAYGSVLQSLPWSKVVPVSTEVADSKASTRQAGPHGEAPYALLLAPRVENVEARTLCMCRLGELLSLLKRCFASFRNLQRVHPFLPIRRLSVRREQGYRDAAHDSICGAL